ncbi:MAG: anti-sigma factor antagonist [Planctomycetota bacterium]|nr:MAG: anti-sigma factor antagonist [Planctomycetota bacterium]
MPTVALGWEFDVECGEGWLIVRPRVKSRLTTQLVPLADELLALAERHLVNRIVLKLDEVDLLNTFLISQLLQLQRILAERYGVLRICGLSDRNREVLHHSRLSPILPVYESPEDAVMACHPRKPR